MQFLIHGADQKTGREMTIVVDARDRTEAEQRVLYNDILIASMAKFAEPVVIEEQKPADLAMELERPGYLRPEPRPEEREKQTRTPIYKEILRGAKWLGGLAIFVKMVGVFLVLVAACLVAVPLIPWLRVTLPLEEWPIAWFVSGAVLLVMAFGCMLCGASVSMMSGLALAVRDMARNSFAEEPDVKSISRIAVRELLDSEVRQLPVLQMSNDE
ncbi:MAG TPA: hypothetical protein VGP94_16510 [Tepidisphaeraceae bacterium]|jgi:hypothetical protein|nr:hypothetical protein [Tepidisphaeraceae bacterium]